MISLTLNGLALVYAGPESQSLLSFLRQERGLTAAKDGCSAQAACGACLVEVNGKAVLACVTPMGSLQHARVVTLEGLPEALKRTLAEAFVAQGAVQCGFCTPGFITRAKALLCDPARATGGPTREEVVRAVRPHLCRCTGYVKVVDAILAAGAALRGAAADQSAAECPAESAAEPGAEPAAASREEPGAECPAASCEKPAAAAESARTGETTKLGESARSGETARSGAAAGSVRYQALERALGTQAFMDDLHFADLLHGALHFSEHPRARIVRVDCSVAAAMPGVRRVLTAKDVPGERRSGLHVQDWPLYVAEGEITRCVGDVLACVIAESPAQARAAAAAVRVDYAVLEALTDMDAAQSSPILLTPEGNVLARVATRQGEDVERQLAQSAFTAEGTFSTPAVEHAFLEVECSVALPRVDAGGRGLGLYSMSQWIAFDRRAVAALLKLPLAQVSVIMVDTGGAFGGKEDCSTQLHAALGAWLLDCPVKVKLSRPESLRMHAKRHATHMHYRVGCDARGRLTALKASILADSGAYASTGKAVMLRMAGHATGAYHIPHQNIEACAVYTNNPPGGAFRGFGVCQVTFALETLIDDLCLAGSFDRWQFRRDNALSSGGLLPTGQRLTEGMSRLPQCLDALKPAYDAALAAGLPLGLACGIKNTGFGNGLAESCSCRVAVLFEEASAQDSVQIDHAWSELGQGLHSVARAIFVRETGLPPDIAVHVRSGTDQGALADATTASRGSFQLGLALVQAARAFKQDWDALGSLEKMRGRVYHGAYQAATEGPGITQTGQLSQAGQAGQTGQAGQASQISQAGQTGQAGPQISQTGPQISQTGQAEDPLQPLDTGPLSHEAYSFAAQMVICNPQGDMQKVLAAHDSGTPVDRLLYEGQVEGGVVMGLGFALSEALPLHEGRLTSDKLRDLGLLRAHQVPPIEVIIVEGADPRGPQGLKGLGEITCIPTAPALTNALRACTGRRITDLPVRRRP